MGDIGNAAEVCLVVPCFQEAGRLDGEAVMALTDASTSVLLVDDGSTDGTSTILAELARSCARIDVLTMPTNVGKGEAVRHGLLHVLERTGVRWVGYVDADMATPPTEVRRLVSLALDSTECDVLIASRVAMLGRTIARSPFRHYTGRVFATGASLVLAKPVYDTQCGTKLIRTGAALNSALVQPFRSRWAFDVELLGRLAVDGVPADRFREEPLWEWSDVGNSKRSVRSSIRATLELVGIGRDLAHRKSTR